MSFKNNYFQFSNLIKNYYWMIFDKVLDRPHEIKIELTHRCNKNCSFCFNKNSNPGELKTEEVLMLLKKIKDSGIKRVRFTGGEPLLRKDLNLILKSAKKSNLYVKINTNGLLINKNNIQDSIKYCDEFLISFHETKKFPLKAANQIKKNKRILYISTIATKQNIKEFNKFENIIKIIKPNIWFWNYPIPNKKELIDWKSITSLVKKIKKSSVRAKAIRFPLCNIKRSEIGKYIEGCRNCGPYDHLVVGADSQIHLCNSIKDPIGNINNDLLKIWKNQELVRKFKTNKMLPKICKKCEKKKNCLGGCRFSARLYKGNLNSPHILCDQNV